MSSLSPLARLPRSGLVRLVSYFAGAVVLALLGRLLVSLADTSIQAVIGVAALAGAIGLAVHGIRGRTLTSPLMLLGVPLLLSLAAAMLPITKIFSDWSSGALVVAVLIVIAPIVGVALAVLATDGRIPVLQSGTSAEPHAGRLLTACWFMVISGTIVYAIEYASIGGAPILSSNIDKTRFSITEYGPLHVLTEGIPLAFLIATWARVARSRSFSAAGRRSLEGVMCVAPAVLMLGGGRSLVMLPLISALVVSTRYLSRPATRRLLILLPIAVLAFSSALFVARLGQNASLNPSQEILYNGSTQRASPFESAYRALSVSLGEQLRVVSELHETHTTSPPFTTTLWFAHNVVKRAVDPHDITRLRAGGWLTSTYAGQLLLDFGLLPAVLFGVALGAVAHLLYRRFAAGRSIPIIWLYAYLAGPIAMSFYINIFLYFIFPIIDAIGLFILSRVLIKPSAERSPATRPPAASSAPSLA